jgi:hypothetical protein
VTAGVTIVNRKSIFSLAKTAPAGMRKLSRSPE